MTLQQQVENMISGKKKPAAILTYIVRETEKLLKKNEICSILALDENGLLRNAASPGLPKDYLAAIDKLKPHPGIGTCASAAATGRMVITPDFLADDKWSELKHLPMALGYVGAWSMPVKDAAGNVLGTLGVYLCSQRNPTKEEVEKLKELADVTATVFTWFPANKLAVSAHEEKKN